MTGTKIVGITSVFAVLLCAFSVDAFKCYQCVGLSDSDKCSDSFSKSSDLETTNCMACMKTKTNGVVVRACSPIALGSSQCEKSGDVEGCICDSDLCNGSNILAVSMATLLAATLAFYIAKL